MVALDEISCPEHEDWAVAAMIIIAEIGLDMTRFPTGSSYVAAAIHDGGALACNAVHVRSRYRGAALLGRR